MSGKDRGRERVPVPWSHRDKRIGEWIGPALFNLTVKKCWESAKRVLRSKHLGELLILTHQSTSLDSIYKIGKARKHFLELASRGSRWGPNRLLVWHLASELDLGWQENPWRPLSTDASRIRGRDGIGPWGGWEAAGVWKIAWIWIRSQFSLLQISQRKFVHSKTSLMWLRRPIWTASYTPSGYLIWRECQGNLYFRA